jgi:O-antigen ligase
LATQSRGAYVALVCAAAFVPWRRYLRLLVPLLAGVVLGAVAIATSPNAGSVPLLAFALVGAIGISLLPARSLSVAMQSRRFRIAAVCVALGALVVLAVSLHHEVGLRAFAPSDRDRSIEWSTAWHQWGSAPFFGVGPDHLLVSHAADGTYAYFAHNEYLQIAADAGAIGLALLLAVAVAVVRATRRVDVLSSCACATLVCFAVGGAFDYDWHLTFLGFLGGWCAGLAASSRAFRLGALGQRGGEGPAVRSSPHGRS